jgi:serine/threonine protein kinase
MQFAGQSDGFGETTLQANTVLQRRYKVLGILGGGGMGTVYQARDLNFPDVRRLVAVKEMLNPSTDSALHASTLKTFQREANILATLNHPAIPKIFDFFDQNDRMYLVMEYINGSDMESLLSKTRELPMDKLIEWSIDLCDVVNYLHTQPSPIVFRDLKPSNIMVDNFGKIRLIDFGIAKIFDSGVKKHTMIGTEGYCAPEQYKGDVTILSDIYALGATLHHILTRKDPRLETPFSFAERPIPDYNSQVPDIFINVVEKALEFEPAKRWQSCAEMKAELEKLRHTPQILLKQGGKEVPALAGATDFFADISSKGSVEPRWKFTTEDEIRGTPISYRDYSYIGSYDTNIWALNTSSGAFAWKYATHGGIAASPVIDESNRLVMVGSEDNNFYALDHRTGKLSWSYSTQDKIRSTAYVVKQLDAVFFGSDDGYLYALGTASGRFLWKYQIGESIRTRPYVSSDVVIVGSESGEIFGITLDGKRKWSYRTRRAVTSSPFVDGDGICYIGSADNFIYALDASSGYSSWRFRTNGPVISTPTGQNDLLYCASTDGCVYAIQTRNAKEKWKFTTDKPIVSSPLLHQGSLYIGGTDDTFYCLDAVTGKEKWRFRTAAPITGSPYIINDVILFGSLDKTLYALPLVS